MAQAINRVVGSLLIVTTQQAEVSGAMLSSWVSQATFKVAVAKERAIESLLYKIDKLLLEKISFVAIALLLK